MTANRDIDTVLDTLPLPAIQERPRRPLLRWAVATAACLGLFIAIAAAAILAIMLGGLP